MSFYSGLLELLGALVFVSYLILFLRKTLFRGKTDGDGHQKLASNSGSGVLA